MCRPAPTSDGVAARAPLAELDAIIGEQVAGLDAGEGKGTLAALEVRLQDRVMATLGHTTLTLLGNSSRPLRLRIVTLYFEATDIREHVLMQRASLRDIIGQSQVPQEQMVAMHRAFLVERTTPLRKRLSALPVSPSLIEPTTKKPRR